MDQVMPAAISLPLFWPKRVVLLSNKSMGRFLLELYQPSLPNKKSQFCRELLFHSQGSQNTYSMLCMYSFVKVPEHTSRRGVSRQTWAMLGRPRHFPLASSATYLREAAHQKASLVPAADSQSFRPSAEMCLPRRSESRAAGSNARRSLLTKVHGRFLPYAMLFLHT